MANASFRVSSLSVNIMRNNNFASLVRDVICKEYVPNRHLPAFDGYHILFVRNVYT